MIHCGFEHLFLPRQFVEKKGHFLGNQHLPIFLLDFDNLVFLCHIKICTGILSYNYQLNCKVKLSRCHCHHLESYAGGVEMWFQQPCVKLNVLQNQIVLLFLFDNQSTKIVKIVRTVKHLQLGNVIVSDRLSPLPGR